MPVRIPLAVVLGALALALLAAPRAAGATPLVGIVEGARTPGSLARLDPVTLRRTSAAVKLRGYLWGHGRSPDGTRMALGLSARKRSLLQIVDLRGWRTERTIALSGLAAAASVVSWPRPDRLIAFSGFGERGTVVVVEPNTGAILQRIALRGEVRDAHRTATGVVVLSSPAKRIGHAHLTTVDADGRVRSVVLRDIRAGFIPPPSNNLRRNQVPVSHTITPALAVDDSGRARVRHRRGPAGGRRDRPRERRRHAARARVECSR